MLAHLDFMEIVLSVVSVLLVTLSASLHEFGHAYMAHRCGDDTAKEQGRLTPNPLAHIDPFGSVLLPLMLSLSGLGYIAYAKPVPYNPYRLRNRRRDEVLVAVAGPLANIVQALVGAIVLRLGVSLVYGELGRSLPMAYLYDDGWRFWAFLVLQLYVEVNCSLAFFNLLPVPPLDGSKLLFFVLPERYRPLYYRIQHYAMPVTLAVIWLLPELTGVDPVGWWLDVTAGSFSTLLLGW